MKIDLIAEGAPECPLIRIYGNELREFVELREQARFLGDVSGRKVSMKAYLFYNVDSFRDLELGNLRSAGIELHDDIAHWQLNQPEWHVVSALIDGLIGLGPRQEGHQWLTGPEAQAPLDIGEISVLLSWSRTGTW